MCWGLGEKDLDTVIRQDLSELRPEWQTREKPSKRGNSKGNEFDVFGERRSQLSQLCGTGNQGHSLYGEMDWWGSYHTGSCRPRQGIYSKWDRKLLEEVIT